MSNSYKSYLDVLNKEDHDVTPGYNLSTLNEYVDRAASQTIQKTVKTGFLGLNKKVITEYANPELHNKMQAHQTDKAKLIMGAECHQIATKAQLVKDQCDIELKHLVSQYAQDKSKQNIERLNAITKEMDLAHIQLQQQVAVTYDEAFAEAEKIKSPFIKERLLSAMASRIDNLFTAFDNQYRSLLDSFNNASQLLKK
jgi:hypothetical protein